MIRQYNIPFEEEVMPLSVRRQDRHCCTGFSRIGVSVAEPRAVRGVLGGQRRVWAADDSCFEKSEPVMHHPTYCA